MWISKPILLTSRTREVESGELLVERKSLAFFYSPFTNHQSHNEFRIPAWIDFNHYGPILSGLRTPGEPMAERVAAATDPLNLMRVMPPQGARSF